MLLRWNPKYLLKNDYLKVTEDILSFAENSEKLAKTLLGILNKSLYG